MKFARPTMLLAAIVLALAAPLATSATAATPAIAPTTGTVAGTVTGVNGAPVVGACVNLDSYGSPWTAVFNTNAQGAYTISGVAASFVDPYTVVVDASCGVGANAANYLRYASTDVYVTGGQTSTVNPALTLGGSIAGRVLLQGAPVAGVCIYAFGFGVQYEQATSAADGSYVVAGIPAGSDTVTFRICNSDFSHTNIQPVSYGQLADGSPSTVTVQAGSQLSLGDQTVLPGGEVDIKLTDLSGNPLTTDVFPIVQLMDRSYQGALVGIRSLTPDGNGYWRAIGLLPKPYEIDYYDCSPLCRPGPIGYYAGKGVGGSPTPVVPTAGGPALVLTDAVSIPAPSTSSTALTISPASPAQGQSVTVTAAVTDPQTGAIPTGTVEFEWDQGSLGIVALDNHGVAAVTSSALPEGIRTIWASYSGDGESDSFNGPTMTVTVGPPASSGGGGGSGGSAATPVTVTVPAGGSASSDPTGTSPDASNPLVVGVMSPIGGLVTIDKTPPDTAAAHYTVLGIGATITAPAATTANPLTLTFQVFDKQLPTGSQPSDLTIFRDGVAVAACTGAGATPDPCVASAVTSGGVSTIVIRSSHASTWDVEAARVGREAGTDRIATAVAVSQDSFPSGNAGAVVLARADDYPDALVGGPLAASKNAPLLLTQGSTLPSATATEIRRVLPSGATVYVLGGTSAVPASVATQLTGLGYAVVRYSGADRYATAIAVAGALGNPSTVLLATGTNFPDALAAGPAAAHLHGAILLTSGSTLPAETSAYLIGAHLIYAIGGPAATAAPSAQAVVGADRFATAAAVATKFFPSSAGAGVATGTGFPDALAGGAQLALRGAPLLLSSQTGLPPSTTAYLVADHGVLTNVYVYGGISVLGTVVANQLTASFGS
jgi:putative cell wall-binding protein